MKVAILCLSTCQTALSVARHFLEQGRAVDLILSEEAQPKRPPETVRRMFATRAEYDRLTGQAVRKTWQRRAWDGLPPSFKNLLRHHAHRLPGLNRISVAYHARRWGIPHLRVPRHASEQALAALRGHGIDVALLASSSRLIREPLLGAEAPPIIDAHFARLPEHRALDSMAWSILAGAPTGLTLHYVDAGIDTGPILGFHDVLPRPGDTIGRLEARMDEAKPAAFLDILRRLERGEVTPRPQHPEDGTHHRPMTVEELQAAQAALDARLEPGRETLASTRERGA